MASRSHCTFGRTGPSRRPLKGAGCRPRSSGRADRHRKSASGDRSGHPPAYQASGSNPLLRGPRVRPGAPVPARLWGCAGGGSGISLSLVEDGGQAVQERLLVGRDLVNAEAPLQRDTRGPAMIRDWPRCRPDRQAPGGRPGGNRMQSSFTRYLHRRGVPLAIAMCASLLVAACSGSASPAASGPAPTVAPAGQASSVPAGGTGAAGCPSSALTHFCGHMAVSGGVAKEADVVASWPSFGIKDCAGWLKGNSDDPTLLDLPAPDVATGLNLDATIEHYKGAGTYDVQDFVGSMGGLPGCGRLRRLDHLGRNNRLRNGQRRRLRHPPGEGPAAGGRRQQGPAAGRRHGVLDLRELTGGHTAPAARRGLGSASRSLLESGGRRARGTSRLHGAARTGTSPDLEVPVRHAALVLGPESVRGRQFSGDASPRRDRHPGHRAVAPTPPAPRRWFSGGRSSSGRHRTRPVPLRQPGPMARGTVRPPGITSTGFSWRGRPGRSKPGSENGRQVRERPH